MKTIYQKNEEMTEQLGEDIERLEIVLSKKKREMVLFFGAMCFVAGYLFRGII